MKNPKTSKVDLEEVLEASTPMVVMVPTAEVALVATQAEDHMEVATADLLPITMALLVKEAVEDVSSLAVLAEWAFLKAKATHLVTELAIERFV